MPRVLPTFKAFLVISALQIVWVRCEHNITSLSFSGYDSSLRPAIKGGPVVVEVNLYISSFGNIDETSMEYKTFGYFRQFWTDKRLAGRVNESVVLKGAEIEKAWRPDPFCYNARESSLTNSDSDINSMLIIQPTGDITYSRMTIITAECDMDLREFPMDEQNCHLKLGSYSHSTAHITYTWQKPPNSPVIIRSKDLAQFALKTFSFKEYTEIYSTGNFSIIEVDFVFKRRLGYFLIQVYAPDVFVVMMSWIVFWMDQDDMGNRMALGITTILTIMFLLGAINAAMPRVSYPKALDWYLMVSFGFVFFTLIECMAVFVLSRRQPNKVGNLEKETNAIHQNGRVSSDEIRYHGQKSPNGLKTKSEANIRKGTMSSMSILSLDALESIPQDQNSSRNGPNHSLWNKNVVPPASSDENNKTSANEKDSHVDRIARAAFPLAFIGFNVFYWVMYL